MKKMRKALVFASVAALVCLGLLVGCSSGSSSSSSSSSSASSSASSSSSSTSASTTNATWKASNGKTYEFNLVTPGELTVGSDCDYPPFIQLDGTQPAGFEYDMMAALSQEMGLKVNYLEPQKFDTLITTIASNTKLDVAVSSFTITDERKQEIDFTDSYFDSNQAVVVLANSGYSNYSDLAGKTVCAQSGTTGEAWAKENISGITMTPLDTVTDCLNALVAGKAEAAIFDLPTAQAQIKANFTQCKIIGEIPTGEQYGIVVSKDNTGLTAALDEALAEYKASGEYQKLYDKYFS